MKRPGPLKRTGKLTRRTPPPKASPKRLSQLKRRYEIIELVHDRDRVCQGGAVHALAGVPCSGDLAVHEIVSRASWPAGYLEPDNCVLLCSASHRHIHTHPHFGHAIGLIQWSWERHPS